jgi:hypothetical protein
MKKLIVVSLFLVIAGTIILSCKKNLSDDSERIQDRIIATLKSSMVSPSNPYNEYDYIGMSHNDKLIYFVNSHNKSLSHDFDSIYALFYIEGLPSKIDFLNMIDQANVDPEKYTGFLDSLYEKNLNLFKHYLFVRNVVNDSIALSEKVKTIFEYENTLDYSNLSSDKIMALKAAFSVARYSLVLWAPLEEGGLGCGGLGNQMENYIGGKKKTHDIVMADIGGAYTSALFTGNPFIALAGGGLSSGWTWLFY